MVDLISIFLVMTYTLAFNWIYDRVFPVIQPSSSPLASLLPCHPHDNE
ncbi:hypothetical protein [Oceanisphaera psychrotolerans]